MHQQRINRDASDLQKRIVRKSRIFNLPILLETNVFMRSQEKPNAQYAMPPLRLTTGLNVSLRILIISGYQLMALSAVLAVLFKVVTEKVVCTAGSGSTRQCIESSKWQKTVSSDWAFWPDLFQDLKLLIPLIKDYWKGTYRDVSVKSIVIFVVALAYIISPIDLIPDYIIGLGQIDDAVILGLSLYFLEKDLRKYKEWKDRNG